MPNQPSSAPCWLLAPSLPFLFFQTYEVISNPSLVVCFKAAAPHVGFFQVPSTQSRRSEPAECSESSTNKIAELMANSSFLCLDFWWRIAQFWGIQSSNQNVLYRDQFCFRCIVLDWRSPGTSKRFCSSANKKNPRVVNSSWKSFFLTPRWEGFQPLPGSRLYGIGRSLHRGWLHMISSWQSSRNLLQVVMKSQQVSGKFQTMSHFCDSLWRAEALTAATCMHLLSECLLPWAELGMSHRTPSEKYKHNRQGFHPFTMGVFKSSWATAQTIWQHCINKGRTHGREKHVQAAQEAFCMLGLGCSSAAVAVCSLQKLCGQTQHHSWAPGWEPQHPASTTGKGQPGHGQPWWSGWPLVTALLTKRNCFPF